MLEKEVFMFDYDIADFNIYDSIKTRDLDTCVGVVTYSPERELGSMAHLTIESDIPRYIRWLKKHIHPRDTSIYLIGGNEKVKHESGEFFKIRDSSLRRAEEGSCVKINNESLIILAKRKRSSYDIVHEVEGQLVSNGYNLTGRDLFGRKTRDVILFNNGKVMIEWQDYPSGQKGYKFLDFCQFETGDTT